MAHRLERPVDEHFDQVVFGKDQLQNICQLLAAEAGGVSLRTSSHEYDSLQDFLDNAPTENPDRLDINSKQPQVSVEVSRDEVVVKAKDSDSLSLGLVARASQIVDLEQRTIREFLASGVVPGSIVLLLVSGVVVSKFWVHVPEWSFVVGFVVLLITWVISGKMAKNSVQISIVAEKAEGFWRRNRDTIAVNLIVGVVSLLLGFVLAKLK